MSLSASIGKICAMVLINVEYARKNKPKSATHSLTIPPLVAFTWDHVRSKIDRLHPISISGADGSFGAIHIIMISTRR